MIKVIDIKSDRDAEKCRRQRCSYLAYLMSYGDIKEAQFEGDENLRVVLSGTSTKVIGKRGFANCWNLLRFDGLPEVIDEEAFLGCKSMSNFNFSTLRNLSKGAFAFTGLKAVDMPFNIQNIPERCFQATLHLRNLNLNKVETIEDEAFQSSGLKVLDINVNLGSIGKKVFEGCTYLSDIICERIIPPKIESSTFYGTFVKNVWVFSEDQLKYYLKDRYWSKFSGKFKHATPKILKERMKEIREEKDDIYRWFGLEKK